MYALLFSDISFISSAKIRIMTCDPFTMEKVKKKKKHSSFFYENNSGEFTYPFSFLFRRNLSSLWKVTIEKVMHKRIHFIIFLYKILTI